MRLALAVVAMVLVFIVASMPRAYADHERFIVGSMRNVDPSAETITSTSGTCVPTHDRETLECYFTTFGLWKSQTAADAKKQSEELMQELNKDSAKSVREFKKGFCEDKSGKQPDPKYLKYNVYARAMVSAAKAFCDHPSRDSILSLFRTMIEIEGKKCKCVVSDWRATLARQVDRWIENAGPSGLCGVIKVFTLVPQDLKKMKAPIGPLLWTLYEKTVTTHGADDPLCAKSMFKVEEGAMTVSWDAPEKSIDCGEIDFTSALEGMSDPRKK